jgi:tetratricopeptide (TPR) repeat protein
VSSPRASHVVRRDGTEVASRSVDPHDRRLDQARLAEAQPLEPNGAAWRTDEDAEFEALHSVASEPVAASDSREARQRVASADTHLPPFAADEVSRSGLLTKHANDHEERLLAHFFSSPPPEPSDALDEPYHVPMSVGSRRAMWSSLGIFAVAVIGIGGYTVYQQFVMPAPVELGSPLSPDALPAPVPPIAAALPVSPAPSQALSAAAAPEVAAQASDGQPARPLAVAAAPAEAELAVAPASAPAAAAEPAPVLAVAAAPSSGTPLSAADPSNPSARALAPASAPQAAAQASATALQAPTEAAAAQAVGAITPPPSAAVGAIAPPPSAALGAAAHVPAATDPAAPSAVVEQSPTPAVAAHVAEPEASGATPPSYDELLEVGQAFARKGQNDQAREAFQRALEAQPNAAPALAGMAYVYLNMGDRGMAKLFATRAVDADATNSQGWIVLGAALDMLGDHAGARDAYRKCASDGVGSYVSECRSLAR